MNHQPLNISPWAIARVALPVSLGMFVQFIIVFTDNLFLSKLSPLAMNAAGNCGLIYATLIMTGVGLTSGAQILIARRNGSGLIRESSEIFVNTILLCLLIALGLTGLMAFVLPSLSSLWVNSGELASAMSSYMKVRAPGFLFYVTGMAFSSFYIGIARTNILFYTVLTTCTVNVGLNYALIFGFGPFPELGFHGAAVASVIAEASAFLVIVLYTVFGRVGKEYGIRSLWGNPPVKHTGAVVKLGLPLVGQQTLAVMTWTVFFFFVEKLGEAELTVSHIARSMYMMSFISVFGIAQTTKTYVSTLIAEERQFDLNRLIKRMILLNVAGVFILSHGLILYPDTLAGLFTSEPETIAMTRKTFAVVWFAVMMHSVSSVFLNTLEGAGLTKRAFQIELVSIIGYLLLSWYVTIVRPLPIHWVWTNDYLYFGLIGGLSLLLLYRSNWRHNQI